MKGAWGAKGGAKGFGAAPYGKGDGKGKAKGPTGPTLERERLTAEKFAGTVAEWRGKFGYIMPAEPVDHPNAQKKQGKLWVSQTDLLSGASELAVGSECSFHIYTDSTGILGAEEVEDFGGAPAGPKAAVKAAVPAPYGKAAGKGKVGAAVAPYGMAAGKGCQGAWGKDCGGKGWDAGFGGWDGAGGKGFGGKNFGGKNFGGKDFGGKGFGGKDFGGKDKGKGKDGKAKRPSGSRLPRERLTADKFSGEVIEWKGKFGYIMPAEPIEHPDAKKRPDGRVWVSITDCPGEVELAVGTQCAFHVYTDASGTLGAEEVDA